MAHSRSPVIHNHWLAHYGIPGRYVLFPVPPEKLEAAVRGIAALGLRGCNITTPHKQTIFPLLTNSPGKRLVQLAEGTHHMMLEKNRHKVIDTMKNAMAHDRTRSQVFDIGPLGLLEVTRKRVSTGLLEAFSQTCPTCEGRGILLTHKL